MNGRYQLLGGSSRRYRDTWTGKTLSRRQFLKLQGIQPERLACMHRLTGVGRSQRRRRDAGIGRGHCSSVEVAMRAVPVSSGRAFSGRSFMTPSGQSATVEPQGPDAYLVRIAHIPVATVVFVPGKRHRWRCAACRQTTAHQNGMVAHMAAFHFSAACRHAGVAG